MRREGREQRLVAKGRAEGWTAPRATRAARTRARAYSRRQVLDGDVARDVAREDETEESGVDFFFTNVG